MPLEMFNLVYDRNEIKIEIYLYTLVMIHRVYFINS